MNNKNVQYNMESELEKAFCLIKYEMDENLNENIWHTICEKNKKIIKIKLYIFSSLLAGSILALIPALITLYRNLLQSGVYEYSSLIFSDIRSIFSLWKQFGLLLIESLPIMNILLSSTLVLILFIALKNTIRSIIIKNQLSF